MRGRPVLAAIGTQDTLGKEADQQMAATNGRPSRVPLLRLVGVILPRVAGAGVVLASLTSCTLGYMADPEGRTLGVGLSGSGQVQIFVPLCAGERVVAVEVRKEVVSASDASREPPPLLWRASGPVGQSAEGARLALLEDAAFTTVDKPFTGALPDTFGVYVDLGSRREGLQVTSREIPASIAGRDLLAVKNARIAESGVVSPEGLIAYTRSNVC